MPLAQTTALTASSSVAMTLPPAATTRPTQPTLALLHLLTKLASLPPLLLFLTKPHPKQNSTLPLPYWLALALNSSPQAQRTLPLLDVLGT